MSKRRIDEIEDLEDLPDTVEDIEKDPILKPLLDYHKASKMLGEEDESEGQYLKDKTFKLNELLKNDFYQNSMIANAYEHVLENYKRLLFIMARYSKMADDKMVEVKKIVQKRYILKEKQIELKKIEIEKVEEETKKRGRPKEETELNKLIENERKISGK